jgi:OPT family oligopeptide transporter
MSREQKDRWWLDNIFRGNMAQLTLRSAITGFLLGGVLSATNLYIGAKTGWTLGVGLTSVILAFAMFRVMSSLGARDMTILENNASQSIATAAGYMTGPLISGIAAYMMVKNALMPWWQMMLFNVVLSILGVLVAFPMKRRFINDEQAPFPEGQACGVVLDTLYTGDSNIGFFKAKVLVLAGLLAGGLKFLTGEAYQTFLQVKVFGLSTITWMSEHIDAWYYKLAEAGKAPIPKIADVDVRQLGLSPTLDIAMFGAGGLMSIKYAANMLVGMVIGWVVLAPIAVSNGWVMRKGTVLLTSDKFSYRDVLTAWVLWPGVAMLVCASMASFFAKPEVIINAFKGLTGKKDANANDPLKGIEVPLWVSWVGVPVVGAIAVWMAHDWFQVNWWLGALSIPLIIILTLIAVNATAATSITPTGSLSKITQFTFGVLDPKHPQTNLMTSLMTTEVASNAANLLMDIKPGYMLGGKPRHQAWGHCIGIIAGALASTPLFFILFLNGHKDNPFTKANPELASKSVEDVLLADASKFPFPGAVQWKGISEFIGGLTGDVGLTKIIHPSALTAMIVAAVLGITFELIRVARKNKFPVAPVAIGLGMVLPPDSTFWMFLGALFFYVMGRIYKARTTSMGNKLWVQTHEPICAGLIAGAALIGIGDILVNVFVLPAAGLGK